jgi:hypothetical protein
MTAVITALVLIAVFLGIVGATLRLAGRADERHASIDDDVEQAADDRALEQEKDRLYGGGW